MAAAFGLHLGSTSCCLAVYKDGKTDVVANDAGDRVTPAIVAFTHHDQAVGLAAKQGLIRNAVNTVSNVKQILGRNFSDPIVKKVRQNSSVKIVDKNNKAMYEVEYKERQMLFSPTQVVELIFKKMMGTAQLHGDGDIHDTVLAVPLKFNNRQIQELRCGAETGGFNVLRVISEPSAVLLAYDIGQNDPHEYSNVLVYKLGGTSLQVTIVNVNSGIYTIVASVEDSDTGGDLYNNAVVDYFAAEFKRKWKLDISDNKRAQFKLLNAAENCKHVLSRLKEAQSFVESLYEGLDFQCQMSRPRFDGLCSSLVQQCMQPLDMVLNEAKLTKQDIHKVILCGGAIKIPCLQKQIKSYFNDCEVLMHIAPDEVIAVGAAKQAAILTGNNEEAKLLEKDTEIPCLSQSVSMKVSEGCSCRADSAEIVFHRLTPIPVRRTFTVTLDEGSTACSIDVLETSDASTLLAQLTLEELPAKSEVNVVFHVRREGSLHITCTEPTSGKTTDALIESS